MTASYFCPEKALRSDTTIFRTTYGNQVLAHIISHKTQQGLVAGNTVRAGLQCHHQQAQAHVDHHVRVVAVVRVGQGDEEAQELSDTRQTVWDPSRSRSGRSHGMSGWTGPVCSDKKNRKNVKIALSSLRSKFSTTAQLVWKVKATDQRPSVQMHALIQRLIGNYSFGRHAMKNRTIRIIDTHIFR